MKIYNKPGSKERLFEMMKGVTGMKPKLNEDYDSPKEKDEKYLNKSVNTNSTDISKYDGDLNYPVEKDLRVNSDMIHQEPVDECDTPMSNTDGEYLNDTGAPQIGEEMTLGTPEPTHGDSFGQPPSDNRLNAEYADLIKQFGQDRVNMLFPSGQKGFIDSRTRGNYSVDAIKQNLSK
ncbi:MAG: hypothetical protein HC836_28015 [Richelia sp. RM2_1_2]|nr:hypothetical protein [Richelia sp. RM2_1_2]